MNVEELIEKLQAIENKDLAVFAMVFEDSPNEGQDRITEVKEMHEGRLNYVRLC